jgi:hypothetical protein
MGVSAQIHALVALPLEEKLAATHQIGNWMGLRAGLNAVAKIPGRNQTPA